MRPLHRMNATRIDWISREAARAFPGQRQICLLDVGCGAGIASEALAKRGFSVLGIDAAPATVSAARAHASQQKLPVEYRCATAEQLATEGAQFPIITALEVVEHVPDPGAFLEAIARLAEPGGLVVISTLNRTARSFLAAKIGAEYLLRWLPIGTHDWRRFTTPAELSACARKAGLRIAANAGLEFDPLRSRWRVTHDLSVNYMVAFRTSFANRAANPRPQAETRTEDERGVP